MQTPTPPELSRDPSRDEVPPCQTWDLSPLFGSDAEWREAKCRLEQGLCRLQDSRPSASSEQDTIVHRLRALESVYIEYLQLRAYARLRLDEDSQCPVRQQLHDEFLDLETRVNVALAQVRTMVAQASASTLERLAKTDGPLVRFRPFISNVTEHQQHLLSPELESALAELSGIMELPFRTYSAVKHGDIQFEAATDGDGTPVEVTFSSFDAALELDPDTGLRHSAYRSFTAGLQRYRHALGVPFIAEVKRNIQLARLRGYPTVFHMLLSEDSIAPEVYHRLLDSLLPKVAVEMRRMARLRARLLGQTRLLLCDVKAPLGPGFETGLSFAEARDSILGSASILGDAVRDIIGRAFADRWIDWAANAGKNPGAVTRSPYGVHPFLFLNWRGTARDAFVLAHELGHAVHDYLAQVHQPVFAAESSSDFFGEAPALLMELALANHLLTESRSARLRRWVLAQLLGTYHHNYVMHLLEAEFQRRVYRRAEQEGPITVAYLSQTMGDLLREFWGDTVHTDAGAELTWMRQPHYYMGLYPYTYAAGLTVATSVHTALISGKQRTAEKWTEVLSAGGTLGPFELCLGAGVDMKNQQTYDDAAGFLRSLVDELENYVVVPGH